MNSSGNRRTERYFVVTGKILVSLLLLPCYVLLMYKQNLNSHQDFPIKSRGGGRLHLSSIFKAREGGGGVDFIFRLSDKEREDGASKMVPSEYVLG